MRKKPYMAVSTNKALKTQCYSVRNASHIIKFCMAALQESGPLLFDSGVRAHAIETLIKRGIVVSENDEDDHDLFSMGEDNEPITLEDLLGLFSSIKKQIRDLSLPGVSKDDIRSIPFVMKNIIHPDGINLDDEDIGDSFMYGIMWSA